MENFYWDVSVWFEDDHTEYKFVVEFDFVVEEVRFRKEMYKGFCYAVSFDESLHWIKNEIKAVTGFNTCSFDFPPIVGRQIRSQLNFSGAKTMHVVAYMLFWTKVKNVIEDFYKTQGRL